jgi:hypothetical protein
MFKVNVVRGLRSDGAEELANSIDEIPTTQFRTVEDIETVLRSNFGDGVLDDVNVSNWLQTVSNLVESGDIKPAQLIPSQATRIDALASSIFKGLTRSLNAFGSAVRDVSQGTVPLITPFLDEPTS